MRLGFARRDMHSTCTPHDLLKRRVVTGKANPIGYESPTRTLRAFKSETASGSGIEKNVSNSFAFSARDEMSCDQAQPPRYSGSHTRIILKR